MPGETPAWKRRAYYIIRNNIRGKEEYAEKI